LVFLASDYHKIIELLSDFKHCASHDLIEPLRKISSFSSRLREVYGKNLGEQQKVYLNAIERSSLKMKKYIDDLARFAMIAKVEIEFESIDLEEIFAKVLETLSAEIEKNEAKITIESPHTLISVWQQLKEIFEHIISNSLHSKKENAPLTIHITSQITADGFLETHIKDSGVGFDEKYINKIFKPFQRLHRHQLDEKSGLGLAICKLIVVRLGGNISAKSSPDKGATFTVRLPLEPVNKK
jgi:light-regulated signal transduction histidine kinase (bacteriophytochrome)